MTKTQKANKVAVKILGFCLAAERDGRSAKVTMGMALGAAAELGYIAGENEDFSLKTLRNATRELLRDAGRLDLLDVERF